jgi:hypothetical protein
MAQFDNIAAGDQVIVTSGSYDERRDNVHAVEHVTATQFTAGGRRFTKRGREVGGLGHWAAEAEPATPERIAEVTAQNTLLIAVAAAIKQSQAITARLHEIARGGGATHDALHAASNHLGWAMEYLTPPDAAAPQGGEVEG